ncbi:MAG: 5-(carboxyamino)imidazole ribonucleotide mutase [Firmicutes bacterium]|nr:5-(carboxyamino)imidazole ribonucleotide mutase [Bacillota bacterium]
MSKQVLILCGSDSDLPVIKPALEYLMQVCVEYEIHIASAHRTADYTASLAKGAKDNGFQVIICAAGGAAHLAGCVAAQTTLPVIGIPIKNDTMSGLDALYATVQMPPGIPVATVAINGAKNAAILATQIIALNDDEVYARLYCTKDLMKRDNLHKDARLQELGVDAYLEEKKKN